MEKASLLPQTKGTVEPTPRRPAAKRPNVLHAAAVAILLALLWIGTRWGCRHPHRIAERDKKVPLEVHIMSKCPDAQLCLQDLVIPAMANVSSKVDFKLSFIGQTTDEDDGVKCMHGQTECLGNIVLLCAAAVYPNPKNYLGFAGCLIRQYPDIPKKALIEDCALEYGMSFDKLNDCMSEDNGAYGMGLLRNSVTRSKKAGVSTSCTVRLNGKTRCVADGGRFKDCEAGSNPKDLIRDIKKLYEK